MAGTHRILFNDELLWLTLLLFWTADGIKLGPSLSSLSSPMIRLENFPNYSVLIPLSKYSVHASPSDLARESARWWDTKVIVEAPKDFRIAVVVQLLNLGGEYADGNLTQELNDLGLTPCVDSIEIYEDGKFITDTCGKVNITDKAALPMELHGPRSYLSEGNSIIFGLQFGRSLRLSNNPDWIHLAFRHEKEIWNMKFSLAVTFTAVKDCSSASLSFRSCTSWKPFANVHDKVCIREELFCNSLYNCPYNEESDIFGSDEDAKYCRFSGQNVFETQSVVQLKPEDHYWHKSTLSPNQDHYEYHKELTLGPTGTILLIVVTALAVIVLGVTIRMFCTNCMGPGSPFPATPRLSTASAVTADPEIWTVTSACQRQATDDLSFISGLVFQSQTSRFDSSKDLPPSYYELFPESVEAVPVNEGNPASGDSSDSPAEAGEAETNLDQDQDQEDPTLPSFKAVNNALVNDDNESNDNNR